MQRDRFRNNGFVTIQLANIKCNVKYVHSTEICNSTRFKWRSRVERVHTDDITGDPPTFSTGYETYLWTASGYIQSVPGVKVTTSGFNSRVDSGSKTSYTHGSNWQRFGSYEFLIFLKVRKERAALCIYCAMLLNVRLKIRRPTLKQIFRSVLRILGCIFSLVWPENL